MFGLKKSSPVELRGAKINLRPLREEDFTTVFGWLQDRELVELGFGRFQNDSGFFDLIQAYKKEIQSRKDSFFAIETRHGKLIGFSSFSIFTSESRARIGILIASKQEWSKGYGRDAVRSLLEYLFSTKKVEVVELDTNSSNRRAQRCFQSCGFKPIQREWSEAAERIWYEIRKEEF